MKTRFFLILLLCAVWLTWLSRPAPIETVSAQAFPTNTPIPTPARPDASAERYALRLWTEAGLIDALIQQIGGLRPGDEEGARAARLLARELEHRYPGSPRDYTALLAAMRSAPPGAVDMRELVRRYAEETLNAVRPQFDATARLDIDGWRFELTAADFDRRGALDMLARVVRENVFDAYFLALVDLDGTIRVLAGDMPAIPYDGRRIAAAMLADVTGDGADELVVTVEERGGGLRTVPLSARGGQAVNITAPGQVIRGAPVQFQPFNTLDRETLSALWQCQADIFERWTYTRNALTRTSQQRVVPEDGAACALHTAGSLYTLAPAEALSRLGAILGQSRITSENDDRARRRASLAEAMIIALDGRVEAAAGRAAALDPGDDAWLARQRAQFVRMASGGASALAICETLAEIEALPGAPTLDAPRRGICDPGDALLRYLTDNPPRRDAPIRGQLEALGLTIAFERTVRQAGRLDRTLLGIDYAGETRWIAFAPLTAEVFTTEAGTRPTDLPTPAPRRDAPTVSEAIYALILRGSGAIPPADLRLALTQLDNTGAVTAEAGLIRAFLQDLLNNRAPALAGYYEVWARYPATVWGQMAALHLERR
jgi:hypothetical protein